MDTNCPQDIPLNWGEIFYPASVDMDLNEILEAHSAIFSGGYVDPMDFLHLFDAWPVAYALCEKTETQLGCLVKEGTIEQLEFSEWTTSIVPTVKENGSIRVWGGYKQTIINQQPG